MLFSYRFHIVYVSPFSVYAAPATGKAISSIGLIRAEIDMRFVSFVEYG